MFTIIGGDGKEYGPVTTDQIRSWIAAGRANLDTKARAIGSEEWRRLGDYAEFSSPGGPPPLTGSPGAAPAASAPVSSTPTRVGPVDARTFAADLMAHTPPLDISGCLGRSFELWKTHFLPLVGITLLVLLVQIVANMIPVLGVLAGLLLTGIFYGGLYYYYLGRLRGQPRTVGDAFAGFSKSPGALILANVLITLITLSAALALAGPFLFPFLREAISMQGTGEVPPLPSGVALIGIAAAIVVVIFLSISWVFTFPLIIDQGLSAWTAMSVSMRVISRQWFRVFVVLFLAWLLSMLGLIAFFIGIIFTLPLLFAAVVCAYEDLCNPPPHPAQQQSS